MSRIGKKPVVIPSGVKVSVQGATVMVEGPKGKLQRGIPVGISIKVQEDKALVERPDNARQSRANQGLIRALLANMVHGVHQGFERALEINGVGYRAEKTGKTLVMLLGFSHKVEIPVPDNVDIVVDKPTRIVVKGIDREQVGQVAAMIRAIRKPDPYKAKGISYEGEKIIRKAGKKTVG